MRYFRPDLIKPPVKLAEPTPATPPEPSPESMEGMAQEHRAKVDARNAVIREHASRQAKAIRPKKLWEGHFHR